MFLIAQKEIPRAKVSLMCGKARVTDLWKRMRLFQEYMRDSSISRHDLGTKL